MYSAVMFPYWYPDVVAGRSGSDSGEESDGRRSRRHGRRRCGNGGKEDRHCWGSDCERFPSGCRRRRCHSVPATSEDENCEKKGRENESGGEEAKSSGKVRFQSCPPGDRERMCRHMRRQWRQRHMMANWMRMGGSMGGPPGIGPHVFEPHGFGPHGFEHHGFGPHGLGPHGFGPHGFGHHGFEPHGFGHHGFGPHGFGHHGFGPHGFGHHGFGHHGFKHHGLKHHGFGKRAGFFGRRCGFRPEFHCPPMGPPPFMGPPQHFGHGGPHFPPHDPRMNYEFPPFWMSSSDEEDHPVEDKGDKKHHKCKKGLGKHGSKKCPGRQGWGKGWWKGRHAPWFANMMGYGSSDESGSSSKSESEEEVQEKKAGPSCEIPEVAMKRCWRHGKHWRKALMMGGFPGMCPKFHGMKKKHWWKCMMMAANQSGEEGACPPMAGPMFAMWANNKDAMVKKQWVERVPIGQNFSREQVQVSIEGNQVTIKADNKKDGGEEELTKELMIPEDIQLDTVKTCVRPRMGFVVVMGRKKEVDGGEGACSDKEKPEIPVVPKRLQCAAMKTDPEARKLWCEERKKIMKNRWVERVQIGQNFKRDQVKVNIEGDKIFIHAKDDNNQEVKKEVMIPAEVDKASINTTTRPRMGFVVVVGIKKSSDESEAEDKETEVTDEETKKKSREERQKQRKKYWMERVQIDQAFKRDQVNVSLEDTKVILKVKGDDTQEAVKVVNVPQEVDMATIETRIRPRKGFVAVTGLKKFSDDTKPAELSGKEEAIPEPKSKCEKQKKRWAHKAEIGQGFKQNQVKVSVEGDKVNIHADGDDGKEVMSTVRIPKEVDLASIETHVRPKMGFVVIAGMRKPATKEKEDSPMEVECDLPLTNKVTTNDITISEDIQSSSEEEAEDLSWDVYDLTNPDDSTQNWVQIAGQESVTDTYRLNIPLTKFSPDEVKLKIVGRELQVFAEQDSSEDGCIIHRKFERKYMLPGRVNVQLVKSRMSADGILTIIAPTDGPSTEKTLAIESN